MLRLKRSRGRWRCTIHRSIRRHNKTCFTLATSASQQVHTHCRVVNQAMLCETANNLGILAS